MRTGRSEPHALAGAYALDALTSIDRRRFERHLTRCEQCARELTGMREAAARLAVATAAEPPHWLIERAVTAAKHTRQLPLAARPPARPRPSGAAGSAGPEPRRTSWQIRLAAALAAGLVIITGILGLATRAAQHQAEDQRDSHAVAAILTARDATMISGHVTGGGAATVVMSAREHALVFAAAGLPALPRSQRYELWLMGPGGDTTAGMLPAPRQGMSGPVLASGLKTGDRLGLTVEPAGGSPRPTSPMILVLAL
jgi:anti-sigma-K factor RskA